MHRERLTVGFGTRASPLTFALGFVVMVWSASAGAQVPAGTTSPLELEPRPPTRAELAAIEADIDAREVQRMMRFRGRWRVSLDTGPTWVIGGRVVLDRVEVRAVDPLISFALGGGVRRALSPTVDLRLRASATFPRSGRYGLVRGACPGGGDSSFAGSGLLRRWSVLAEAGVRLRLGSLVPIYLGADVIAGTLWVAGIESTVAYCHRPGPSWTPPSVVSVSTGLSVVPLIGGAVATGVHFGAREQFEFNFQSGYVFHGRASATSEGDIYSVGFLLFQVTFGWAFA